MHRGYIIIWRRDVDLPFWAANHNKPFTKYEAWVDLWMLASHTHRVQTLNNRKFDLYIGQILISERFLKNRWKWKSTTKVRKFLKDLEEMKEIYVEKKREASILTFLKYSIYQNPIKRKEAQIISNEQELNQ